ncbi:MAG: His-Xaa-Ser system protein HxsD [Polyangiaceae bacterium]|nr:His-Xaa-Ser system protein HxsD [Polyangiaceae bacterium]
MDYGVSGTLAVHTADEEVSMSDITTVLGEGTVTVEFDESFYPKDAIYGAAYVFIDRCYVHLDRAGDKRVRVTLRAKSGKPADGEALAGELQNELLGQAWRLSIAAENRQLIESITSRALGGAAGPPGLDELLAMDIDEATAFDDPLGIAMSWEEKYKKKGAADEGADAPKADASASSDAAEPNAAGEKSS